MDHEGKEIRMKLLKEVYKTYEGARKRCAFENAMARGEFNRGDKARFYHYKIVADPDSTSAWRVQRDDGLRTELYASE
jgi:hypothetical protein